MNFVIVLPNSFYSDTRSFVRYPYFFCRFLVRFYAFGQLCGNPAGLYAYDIEQSGHFSARGCCRLIPECISLLIRAYTLPHSLENKEIIRSVLAIFLQGTKELYKRYGKKLDEPLRREQELYRQFIQLLMAHYTKEHEVAFYAEKCGVTAAHFSSAIRRASGYSPLAIITEIIIMNAKAQLKTTRLPVKEIAFSLGFNNHSFFNKYFS